MHKKHNMKLTYNARKLRKEATKEENHLWYDFLRGYPKRFVRQKVVGNYILDFYCADKKLAIEIDGSHHYDEQGRLSDIDRTKSINEHGISVLRFTNREINYQFEAVCIYIDEFIKSMNDSVVNDSIIDRI